MFISPELAYQFSKLFYKNVLRSAVVDIVVDTRTKWDDGLLEICDRIFNYNELDDGISIKELRKSLEIKKGAQ